jgi:S-layer protein
MNITLTTGLDTATTLAAGAGNDAFVATAATLTVNDAIDGGAGTDTLTITDVAAGLTAGVPAGVTIKGIETISVSSTGALGTPATAAAITVQAANAATSTITFTATTAATETITINGVPYTTATLTADASGNNAATAITALINTVLGNAPGGTAIAAVGAGAAANVVTITAQAGKALPSLALSGTGGTENADKVLASTVNLNKVQVSGTVATKEVMAITPTTATAGALAVYIGGAKYTGSVGAGGAAEMGATIAAIINNVLGAGVATANATSGIVTVTAPVAGTALPYINVTNAGTNAVSIVNPIANQTALTTAAAATAFDVSASTDATSFTATSVGGASVAVSATTDATVTNATSGATYVSGGLNVTASNADSVQLTGAKGAVSVTVTKVPATGMYVAASTSTGQKTAWGTTTASKAGVYVTGGTTVSVTERAGTVSSTTFEVSATNSTDIFVGSDANVGITQANTPAGKETIRNLSLDPTGDVTINVSTAYTNAANLKSVVFGTGAYSAYTNGATTASVTGGTTVTVKDVNVTALVPGTGQTAVAGTSKLATVNLSGLNGADPAATLTSDALTNVKVINSKGSASTTVTVNNTTAAHNLALTVGNSGVSDAVPLTVADSVATSVSIASEASAYEAILDAAINSGSKSFVLLNTPQAASITMTNGQSVSLGDLTTGGYAKVATIDGSAAAGAISATVGAVPEQGLTITTGAGKDSITLKTTTSQSANSATAKTLTVSLGAGNDSLLNGGTAAHTMVGATFDGGAGDDTIAATLINVGTASKFTNFEYLGLDVATAGNVDTSILAGITGLNLMKNSAGIVTVQNVTTAMPLLVSADTATAGTDLAGVTKLSFPAAVTPGTADAYTVTFNGTGQSTYAAAIAGSPAAGTIKAGTLDLTGIENLTIASNSSSGFTVNSLIIKDADVRTITATGSQDLSVTGLSTFFGTTATATNGAGVSTVDASAMTGKFSFNAANMVTGYAGTSILGGSGNDTITLSTQASVTVNGGAGDDTIITAQVASTLTGGAGNDTFNVSGTLAGGTATPVRTSIVDAAKGDKIVLLAGGTVTFANKAAVAVETADALFGGVINAYTLASPASGATDDQINWFQLNGYTYIVSHVDAGTTWSAGDNIVRLTGLIDLSKATWVDNGDTGTLTLG